MKIYFKIELKSGELLSHTLYPDLKKTVGLIFNSNQNNEIDCRGVTFLSKCFLNVNIKGLNLSDDSFIKELRKIELNPKTIIRACKYSDTPQVYTKKN